MNRMTLLSRVLFFLFAACFLAEQAEAVITPAPDRAFATNLNGADITVQMGREAANPLLNTTVVRLVNAAPVDVDGDGANDFFEWTGTLITPEWVLTCAHALQGTNGQGAGISAANLTVITDDNQQFAVAEFRVHESWVKQDYLLGNDIALVRLAAPANGVAIFPRLSASGIGAGAGMVFAGYGQQGDGNTGGFGGGGLLSVGVNTFDVVGGGSTTNGAGQQYVPFAMSPSSIAFMDFDKWESVQFTCNGPVMTNVPVGLTNFSSMSSESAIRPAALPACPGSLSVTSEYFNAAVCDFLPGAGDSGGPAFLWRTAPAIPAAGYFITGTPVLYGVMSLVNQGRAGAGALNGFYGNVAGFTLVQPHLQWIYDRVPSLADADDDGDGKTNEQELADGTDPYNAASVQHDPGFAPGTWLRAPLDIFFQNIRILQETIIGANETEVEFTADLLNNDSGRYRELSVNVLTTNLPSFSSVIDPLLDYTSLPELGTAIASAGQTLRIRTFNTNLTQLRSLILSGQLLQVTAYEEQVYGGPTKVIDEETDNAFESITSATELVLIFSHGTALTSNLQVGDILIADASPGGYHPKEPSLTEQFPLPYLSQQIPFEVSSVSLVNGKIHVAGQKRNLNQVLKSGTFTVDDENFNGGGRDLYDPPVENTYTEAEKEDRATQAAVTEALDPTDSRLADLKGMNAIPWHFNDVEITKYLRLSGQVLLRSSGVRCQITFRDFAIKRATVSIDAGIVASMVLETTGTNNNVSVPLVEKQKELASIPLAPPPGIPFTVAGVPCYLNMGFVLAVGAEANAPGGISIPLETSATVGAEIGWADGQTFTTPIHEFVAPHVSDPTVFDGITANAKAWVEARLEVGIIVAGLASAGPSLAIRAEAGFEVAPFNNPWWTLDAGADLVGAFEMNLLGFNVARVEATNHLGTFFHRDAGGPLIPPLAAKAKTQAAKSAGLAPVAGDDVRWALAFSAPNANGAAYSRGFVRPLNGGGYMVGGGASVPSFLGSITAQGTVQWMQTFPNGAKPVDAEQLADGSIMVIGTLGFDWWIAKYDTNGNRQWFKSHRMTADLRDLELGFNGNGEPEFYLAGFQNLLLITQSDPVVMKLDQDGNITWTKVYTLNRDDEVYAIRALRDGNFLLVGRTDSKVGTDLFIGAGNNGLVMKISPAGNVLWANAVAARWGMLFRDAAEAPDGSLYAVGAHGDIIVNYYPSIMVAKFAANGELLNHVLIGDDPDWTDELPDGGDTPYDTATQAAWTENGLVVVGNTGLGANVSAWAACITDELGVRWFSAFDGPAATAFEDVAVTDSGIAALGWAQNVWPITFSNRTPAWMLSLPWEGLMKFHPSAGVRSKFLQPHVFLSSSDTDFLGKYTDGFQNLHLFSTAPVSYVISNATVAVGANVVAGVFTVFDTRRLERVEPSIVCTYDEWSAYHQMTGTNSVTTGDIDGDGIRNGTEFFFGTDPQVGTTNAPNLSVRYDASANTTSVDFSRSRMAACQPFNLQYTTNWQSWLPAPGTTLQLQGTDDSFDSLRLTLPTPDTNHAFFRLELPVSP